MARPRQERKVCCMPTCRRFQPETPVSSEEIQLTVEEYETLRLMDLEGYTQAECAQTMGIARTTVQSIYASARRKVSRMLVEGRPLVIGGGAYRLCPEWSAQCPCGGCARRMARHASLVLQERKDSVMRIAATYENGEVFQHFGHTAQFKLFDTENGKILSTQVVDTQGSGHGALAEFLRANGVEALICGGIGGGAQSALAEAGIKFYAGVRGSADAAVLALLAGKLNAAQGATCDHHHEDGHDCGSHGEGHTCGAHGCGGHSCGSH